MIKKAKSFNRLIIFVDEVHYSNRFHFSLELSSKKTNIPIIEKSLVIQPKFMVTTVSAKFGLKGIYL